MDAKPEDNSRKSIRVHLRLYFPLIRVGSQLVRRSHPVCRWLACKVAKSDPFAVCLVFLIG